MFECMYVGVHVCTKPQNKTLKTKKKGHTLEWREFIQKLSSEVDMMSTPTLTLHLTQTLNTYTIQAVLDFIRIYTQHLRIPIWQIFYLEEVKSTPEKNLFLYLLHGRNPYL